MKPEQDATMTNIQFEYVFDPLCGWCYASAPALEALSNTWPAKLKLMPSGLFSGSGARPLTHEWAGYAWKNDQRISNLTGQHFSELYHRLVLHGEGVHFDSGAMNLALTAIQDIAPNLEAKLLHQLQIARYVEGKDTGDKSVVATTTVAVARENGIEINQTDFTHRLSNDSSLQQATEHRIALASMLMSQCGIRGVPQLLLRINDRMIIIDSSPLYQGGEYCINAMKQIIAEHLYLNN